MDTKFSVDVQTVAGIPVLYMTGDITSECEETLDEVYNDTTNKGHRNIILNFKSIKYINSAGMAILLGLVTQMLEKEHDIKFVSLTPHFKKIIEMIGMTEFVTIYETNEEAIEAFN